MYIYYIHINIYIYIYIYIYDGDRVYILYAGHSIPTNRLLRAKQRFTTELLRRYYGRFPTQDSRNLNRKFTFCFAECLPGRPAAGRRPPLIQ